MNILDRMLETTAIDATDVETDKTLLECAWDAAEERNANKCNNDSIRIYIISISVLLSENIIIFFE